VDSELPPADKCPRRLVIEAITLVGAGQETVKAALQVGTFYLLQQPQLWKTLRQELLTIYPDTASPPSLAELSRLTYLKAVIYESMSRSALPHYLPSLSFSH
jgi:cytochrome P450